MKNNYISMVALPLFSVNAKFVWMLKSMKHLVVILFSLYSYSTFSQSMLKYDTPSPDIGSLIRVNEPSLNLNTGRPNISIPLHTIVLKDFSYDIQINYNSEGNKVDLPVGNVGLGWSITSGQIYRIANGLPDEIYTMNEYIDRTEMSDWNSESNLYKYYNPFIDNNDYDHEPDLDEFVINIGNINASFYVYKDKEGYFKTKISSQNNIYFEVKDIKIGKIPDILFLEDEWKHPILDKIFYPKLYIETRPISIMEITIVDSEGVTYIFGGDTNSIDLSCIYFQDINYHNYYNVYGEQIGNHGLAWDDFHSTLFGTASTWLIKRIILPNREDINFEYTKENLNIIERFDHHDIQTSNKSSNTISKYTIIPNLVNPQYYLLIDKQYDIIYPSLLKSIVASNGDKLDFISSKRNDLPTYGYYQDQKYFLVDNYGYFIPKIIEEKCCFFKLDEIKSKTKNVKFYYTDKSSQRLKLDSLLVNNIEKYKFSYNLLLLPPYNSAMSDNWGYYNGKNYLSLINLLNFDGLYNYRQADSKFASAEILEKIIYPTGGEINFQYELHEYSKIAVQYPFVIKNKNGIAGGVRIKRITLSDQKHYSESVVKDFEYLNEDDTSSGILTVVPKYVTNGAVRVDYKFKNIEIHGDYFYNIKSSTQINWIDNYHINYSRIIESISNGSKTVYSYFNHDQIQDEPSVGAFTLGMNDELYNKCTSRKLDRGLLKSVCYYDNENKLLKKELFTYHCDLSDYLRTINRYALMNTFPIRVSANKIYTYHPYIKRKEVVHYTSNGDINEIEEYKYNKYRLLTNMKQYNIGDADIVEVKTKYLSDLIDEYNSTSSLSIALDSPLRVYDEMRCRNMLAKPIEKVILVNDNIISANVFTYQFYMSNIVKENSYFLETEIPVNDYLSFRLQSSDQLSIDNRCVLDLEYVNFDLNANPVCVVNHKKESIATVWGDRERYPIAVAKNACNNRKEIPNSQETWKNKMVSLQSKSPSSNNKSYTFYTKIPGSVEINLIGDLGYIWYVTGALDEVQNFSLVQQRTPYSGGSPWKYYISNLKNSVIITNVAAGYHTLTIKGTESFRGDLGSTNSTGILNFSYWGQDSIVVGYDDVFFENFEKYDNATQPGFNSCHSFVGPYHLTLNLDPNKNFIVDYQVFKNDIWSYVRYELVGQTYLIDEGNFPIDDIRVYPQNASIDSYNYIPIMGLLKSTTDSRGRTKSYEYDLSGRLLLIRDNDFNVKSEYKYNYTVPLLR